MSSKSGTEEPIPRNLAFEILTNARRRYALSVLRSRSEPVGVGELAEEVAARERGTTVDLLSSKERKSVYTSLYQTHLPKLADAGVVEYDRNRGLVTLADRAKQLDEYVEPRPPARNWSQYYLALAVGGVVVLACRFVGVYPFTELSVLAYAGLIVVSFGALSAVNLGLDYRNGYDLTAGDRGR